MKGLTLTNPGFVAVAGGGIEYGFVDQAFMTNAGTGFGGSQPYVTKLIPIPSDTGTNDKIIVAGLFTSYNGTYTPSIACLNPDGTLDADFTSNVTSGFAGGDITALALDFITDGIFVAGSFTSYNGVSVPQIIRLYGPGSGAAFGTRDTSFNPSFNFGSNAIFDMSIGVNEMYVVSSYFSAKIVKLARSNGNTQASGMTGVTTAGMFGVSSIGNFGGTYGVAVAGEFDVPGFGWTGRKMIAVDMNTLAPLSTFNCTTVTDVPYNGILGIINQFDGLNYVGVLMNEGLGLSRIFEQTGGVDSSFTPPDIFTGQNQPSAVSVSGNPAYNQSYILTTTSKVYKLLNDGTLDPKFNNGFQLKNPNMTSGSVATLGVMPETADIYVGGQFTQGSTVGIVKLTNDPINTD